MQLGFAGSHLQNNVVFGGGGGGGGMGSDTCDIAFIFFFVFQL